MALAESRFEILRHTIKFDMPTLSDEELALSAKELFLGLDCTDAEMTNP